VSNPEFQFFKGGTNIFEGDSEFNWPRAADKTREHLAEAMNAHNLAFLFGSGCSTFARDGVELGIPTMAPLAQEFLKPNAEADSDFPTDDERQKLLDTLGIDIGSSEFAKNLERLLEVLFNTSFVLERSAKTELSELLGLVTTLIQKVIRFVFGKCTTGEFANGDESVLELYQAFYRRLIFRERTLPQPWIFTTNYDLFNERALDRMGSPYCNGFSGTVERRFNPASFRYALAQQMDLTEQKWISVDGYVYLCKLHGSVNWVEDGTGLFPISEVPVTTAEHADRVMIYPTPIKQNASFGFPYSDLLREFQLRVVREQSVLIVLGYSFGDEHINNLIFRALTVPTFRMIAFVNPNSGGVVAKLKALQDPRIWLIGGDGPEPGKRVHYFDTFVEHLMPEPAGEKVDTAVSKVLSELLGRVPSDRGSDSSNEK